MSKTTAQNICFLLSERNPDPTMWEAILAGYMNDRVDRARQLLNGAEPTSAEFRLLAEKFGLAEDDLLGPLLINRGIPIYEKNMAYLRTCLEQGDQKDLAALANVDKVTVSRWFSNLQEPERNRLEILMNFFGLPAGTDLRTDAVFLSRVPVGTKQRRKWLTEHVKDLSATTLRELYPAFERLLKDP